jgi:PiT family inorganic phosphate transporter
MTTVAIMAAMLAATLWTWLMTKVGMPISASHSLIGGLLGAGLASPMGFAAIKTAGVNKVLLAMLISPFAGFAIGLILMVILLWTLRSRPHAWANRVYGRWQLLSVSWMSITHGANDAQKVMGVITAALVAAKVQSDYTVPLWAKVACHVAIALGTAIGGWKVIRTLGSQLTRLKPVHGFAAETAASAVLVVTSQFGVPVSTTHAITGAILGVGASKRLSAVRWGVGLKILSAWVVTLPFCVVAGYCLRLLCDLALSPAP